MLHILKIADQPHLAFLLPLQKTSQPLPTSVLLSAMLAPPSSSYSLDIIRFVTELVQTGSSRHPHRALVLFWSSLLVQFCARMADGKGGIEVTMGLASSAKKARNAPNASVQQDNAQLVLGILLPAVVETICDLNRGSEAQLAGCLTLCAIATSFQLSPLAITGTIADIVRPLAQSRSVDRRFTRGVLTTAASLCSIAQDGSDRLGLISTGAGEILSQVSELVSLLTSLNTEYDVNSLISALLLRFSAMKDSSQAQDRLVQLLSVPEARGGYSSTDLQALCTSLLASDHYEDALHLFAACLQSRASDWNSVVATAMASHGPEHIRTVLHQMQSIATQGSGSQPGLTEEWLNINAAEASQRVLALESVFSKVSQGLLSSTDSSVQQILKARLGDEEAAVLNVLYSDDGKHVLDGLSSTNDILQAMAPSFSSTRLGPSALEAHLKFILGPLLHKHPEIADRALQDFLWSRLLITKSNKSEAAVLQKVVANAPARKNAKLDRFFVALRGIESSLPSNTAQSAVTANAAIVDGLVKHFSATDVDTVFEANLVFLCRQVGAGINGVLTESDLQRRILALLVLTRLVSSVSASRQLAVASRLLQSLRSLSLVGSVDEAALLEESQSDAVLDAIYQQMAQAERTLQGQALVAVVRSLKLQTLPLSFGIVKATGDQSNRLQIARDLYQWANTPNHNRAISRAVLSMLLGSLGEASPTFLIACAIDETSEALLRLIALKHLQAFLGAHLTEKQPIDFQTLVPLLLSLVASNDGRLRHAVVHGIRSVEQLLSEADDGREEVSIWGYDKLYGSAASEDLKYLDVSSSRRLCKELLDSEQALASDAGYLPAFLGGLLSLSKGQDKAETVFKRSVTAYLYSHAVACTVPTARVTLLQALSRVTEPNKLSYVLPFIKTTIKASHESSSEKPSVALLHALFSNFDKRSRSIVLDEANDVWSLLVQSMQSIWQPLSAEATSAVGRLFPHLSQDMRRTAVETMSHILADNDRQAAPEVRKTLCSLDIDALTLVSVLSEFRGNLAAAQLDGSEPKRVKAAGTTSNDGVKAISMSVLAELLEASLQRSLPLTSPLIAEFFELLRTISDARSPALGNVDYLLHLCLSNLSKMLEAATPTTDVVQALRVDILVNAIKVTGNPATFQQALLLLSTIASLAPENVLHSAMPIFTFVGSTVLQRDDNYSFSVVEKVLKSILPPLAASLAASIAGSSAPTDRSFELAKVSKPYLCIFTDAANHLPRHRRSNFFELLVRTLGPENYTGPVAMLLVDRTAHKVARQLSEDLQSSLQLPLDVMGAQSGAVQLDSLNSIWQEIARLRATQRGVQTGTGAAFLQRVPTEVSEHSEKQVDVQSQVAALLWFIKQAVDSSHLVNKLRRKAAVEAAYHAFVEGALSVADADDELLSSLARDCLNGIVAIVPVTTFMNLVQRLVAKGSTPAHVAHGFSLLAARLPSLDAAQRAEASAMLPSIVEAAKGYLEASQGDRSAILEALLAIAQSAGPEEHGSLSTVLTSAMDLAEGAQNNNKDRVLAMGVLRALAGSLGPRIISHLKRLSELCLSVSTAASNHRALVILGLQTLQKLFSAIPTFMNSYISRVIQMSCDAKLGVGQADGSDSETKLALNGLNTTVMKRMPSEEVFSAIFQSWKHFGDESAAASQIALLNYLVKALRSIDRGDVHANYKPIFRFILQVLDTRRLNVQLASKELNQIEAAATRAFVRLVLKLNETTFRPLFSRAVDWAALDLAEDGVSVSDAGLIARRIALYKLSNALSDQLKGLISHYYSMVLDLTIELLDAHRKSELDSAELWSVVIASIDKSAKYDEGTFWNHSRLSKLAPAMIGQLAMRNKALVINLGGAESLTMALTSTVVNLAKAVPDEASLKLLNGSLLTQLRIDDVTTRAATLTVLTSMWSESTLSAVLLGLVPETVPHVSELMENNDVEVIEGTRSLIAAIEGVLGEPLDSYLQ